MKAGTTIVLSVPYTFNTYGRHIKVECQTKNVSKIVSCMIFPCIFTQWLTSTRISSSIGNPSTVFFRSISTDGCRAARPLDLVLVDWDWVTWTWTDPSPNQGEDKVCNVIYDIILFDIGFLFKISIYISNSSLSDSVLSSWRTSSSLSCSGL